LKQEKDTLDYPVRPHICRRRRIPEKEKYNVMLEQEKDTLDYPVRPHIHRRRRIPEKEKYNVFEE